MPRNNFRRPLLGHTFISHAFWQSYKRAQGTASAGQGCVSCLETINYRRFWGIFLWVQTLIDHSQFNMRNLLQKLILFKFWIRNFEAPFSISLWCDEVAAAGLGYPEQSGRDACLNQWEARTSWHWPIISQDSSALIQTDSVSVTGELTRGLCWTEAGCWSVFCTPHLKNPLLQKSEENSESVVLIK